jgi:hypothetical protein
MLRPASPVPIETAGITGSKSTLMSMLSGGSTAKKDLSSLLSSTATPHQTIVEPKIVTPSKSVEASVDSIDVVERPHMVASPADIIEDPKRSKKAQKAASVIVDSEIGLSDEALDRRFAGPVSRAPSLPVAEGLPVAPTTPDSQRFLKDTLKEQAKAIRHAFKEDLRSQEAAVTNLIKEEMKKVSSEDAILALEKKLPSVVAAEVRAQLKTSLDSSFKKSFETSLVPAFQAGTAKMFGQIQSTFESGMQRLIEHSSAAQAMQTREISALKKELATLQSSLDDILRLVKSGGSGGGMSIKAPISDVVQLLDAKRYLDAVEFALEKKDISVVVQVLTFDELTPERFIKECEATEGKDRVALLQLCLLQQVLSLLFSIVISMISLIVVS